LVKTNFIYKRIEAFQEVEISQKISVKLSRSIQIDNVFGLICITC